MKKLTLLFIVSFCVTKSYGQCENDKRYVYYHNLIQTVKDNIQKTFDGILEKYGKIDKILKDLLNQLNNALNKADSGLNQMEKHNEDIRDINHNVNATLESLQKDLNDIENALKLIDTNRKILKELTNAENSANKTVPIPASNIEEYQAQLERWRKFLDELPNNNVTNDVMNMPHSVSDQLNLLENLLTKELNNTDCFEKFHNELKLLFIELSSLFDLNIFTSLIDDIKEKSSNNKNDADNIFINTTEILEKEKQLKNIHTLTNETLVLAEEIQKLKENIKNLSQHNEQVLDDELEKLQEEHDRDVDELNKKYNVKEGQKLLDELKEAKQQIDNISATDVEKDINDYTNEINYYTCVLEKCNMKKPTSDCIRNS